MTKKQRKRLVLKFKATTPPFIINWILVSFSEWIRKYSAGSKYLKWSNDHSVNSDLKKIGGSLYQTGRDTLYDKADTIFSIVKRNPYDVLGKGFPSIFYFCEVSVWV